MAKFWIDANELWYVTSAGNHHCIGNIDHVPELNRHKGNVQDDFADDVPKMVEELTQILEEIDTIMPEGKDDLEDITSHAELLEIANKYEELLSNCYAEMEDVKDAMISGFDYFNVHEKEGKA